MTRKTQKKLRKLLTLVSCAVLLVCVTVVGTVAYLQSTTNTVTNTFSVGNVKFDQDAGLTEAKVDVYGTPVTPAERTTTGNEYKLLPGHTYTKDPTVKIAAGSEEAYVRMIVTISDMADVKAVFGNDFLPQDFVNGWNGEIWKTTGVVTEANNVATYEFRYYKTVNTLDGQDKTLEALFAEIFVPGDIANDDLAKLDDMEIKVVAHAIQADGFNGDEDAAWAAFATETAVTPAA